MKKTQLTVAQLAAAVAGFYIFDKFGGVTAVKEVAATVAETTPSTPECPDGYRPHWDVSARRWVCVPRL